MTIASFIRMTEIHHRDYGNSSAVQNNKAGVSTNSNVKPNNMNKGQSDSKNEKQNNQVVKQKPKCYPCRKLGH